MSWEWFDRSHIVGSFRNEYVNDFGGLRIGEALTSASTDNTVTIRLNDLGAYFSASTLDEPVWVERTTASNHIHYLPDSLTPLEQERAQDEG